MKFKIVENNKQKYFGTQDPRNGKIEINRKLSKTRNLDGSLKHSKYPGLADTIYHELLHAKHPKMTEKETYKKTRQDIKKMTPKMKKKLYSMLPKKKGKIQTTLHKTKHKEMLPGSNISRSDKKPVTKKDVKLARKHLEESIKFNERHKKDHLKAAKKDRKKGAPKGSIAYNMDHAKKHGEAAKEDKVKLRKYQ